MRINKGQFRLTSRKKNIKFDLNRSKGHLIAFLSNRIKWHYYPRLNHVNKFPLHIDLELSSACDLHCPMCYTTTDEFKSKVNRKFMSFDLFKKVIDESIQYDLYSIRISLRGEAFLNPHIFEMIEYAKEKGIKEISSLTHGGMLDEEKFKKLIKLDLDWLTISFDGIGQTYEKIRSPLKFNEQIEKIKKYQEIKKQLGVKKPVIKVQAIWPSISQNVEEFYNIFNPITDQIASNPLIDWLFNDKDIEYEENFSCPQIYQRMVIGSDGLVMLCANDELGAHIIGDVNKQTVYEIWHGEELEKVRQIHKRRAGVKELEVCRRCSLPRKTTEAVKEIDNRTISIENYTKRIQTIGK